MLIKPSRGSHNSSCHQHHLKITQIASQSKIIIKPYMVVSYSIPTLSPSNTIHQPQVLNSIPLVKPHVDVSENWLFMVFSLYLWHPMAISGIEKPPWDSQRFASSRAAWRRSASQCAGCSRGWSFVPAGQSTHPSPNDTRHTDASLGPLSMGFVLVWTLHKLPCS